MKVLTIENLKLGKRFTFENILPETTTEEIWVALGKFFTQEGIDKSAAFAKGSLYKMMKEFCNVKGWSVHIGNPATEGVQRKQRKAITRDEKRSSKKLHKKAKKAAERSFSNGSRSFMTSQIAKKDKHSKIALKPLASLIKTALFQR